MKGGRDNGYTIIEVMVFLAVSGVMFLIAAVFINGKQASAQFTQGVSEFASQLQATVQEVADGQFSSLSTLKCFSSGPGLPPTISSSGGAGQGSNQDCVFLGKVIHLWVAGDPLQYEIFSVAGLRGSLGSPITDPRDALPVPIYDATDPALKNLLDVESMPQSLPLTGVKITADDGSIPASYAFALLNKSLDSSATTSAQSVGLYYVQGVTNDSTMDATAAAGHIKKADLQPAKQVIICLGEGGRNAAVSLGTASNQLDVTVDRSGTTTCAS